MTRLSLTLDPMGISHFSNVKQVESWRPSWISDRQTIHKFSTRPPNDHSCKVTIQNRLPIGNSRWPPWLNLFNIGPYGNFTFSSFFLKPQNKFEPNLAEMFICWISDQCQKQKSCIWPFNEHFCHVWFKSVLWFQKKRWKCEIPIGSNVKQVESWRPSLENYWPKIGNFKCS
jgi:hypothetical protein